MKRALRRHHKFRMRRRAAFVRNHIWAIGEIFPYLGNGNCWAVRNGDNIKACSCWMCGNPRRYFNTLTRQEQLAELEEREERLLLLAATSDPVRQLGQGNGLSGHGMG